MAKSDLMLNSIEETTLTVNPPTQSECKPPESQLFQRMREGDEEAFLVLYRQNRGALYRFALRLSGSASIAEDIVQEVFLALISQPGKYDPTRGSLGNYLFGIAHHQVLRHLGKQQNQIPWEATEEHSSSMDNFAVPDDLLEKLSQEQSFTQLDEAISTLPSHYREAVILCDLEEKSYADAASILNCPIGTIRSRLSRAHLLLMEKMQKGNNTRF